MAGEPRTVGKGRELTPAQQWDGRSPVRCEGAVPPPEVKGGPRSVWPNLPMSCVCVKDGLAAEAGAAGLRRREFTMRGQEEQGKEKTP